MLPLRELTVYEAFLEAKTKYPDNLALTYGDETWTYDELDKEVLTYALKLLALGVRTGYHVGVDCANNPRFVFTVLALSKLGAVAVLVNTRLHSDEKERVLKLTDVSFEINDETDLDSVALASGVEFKKVNPFDDGYILFSSGTTSIPRAIVGNHFARANMGLIQGNDLRVTQSDRVCVTMPLFHCFSFSVNLMSALFYGACLCLPKSMHTGDVVDTIKKYNCSILSGVPSFFHTLISRHDFDNDPLSSLRTGFIGGSGYSSTLFQYIEMKLNMTLLSSLGQTEATAAITTSSLDDSLEVRMNTVGHFIDNVEHKILSNGEICIKGFNVMNLYYKNPLETSKTIDDDGWLHTGDAGHMDGDNLVFTGRIKEVIIRGGENISPREIESVLYDDNRIMQSKALGVPDIHYGEEVALCIIKNEGVDLSEDEIRSRLSKHIADFKVPKYILFMEDFPKTSSGKVMTKELKEQVIKILGLSEEDKI